MSKVWSGQSKEQRGQANRPQVREAVGLELTRACLFFKPPKSFGFPVDFPLRSQKQGTLQRLSHSDPAERFLDATGILSSFYLAPRKQNGVQQPQAWVAITHVVRQGMLGSSTNIRQVGDNGYNWGNCFGSMA